MSYAKINHPIVRQNYKSTGEIGKNLTQDINYHYSICPFTITLGAINSTEAGYKSLTHTPTDFKSFSRVFTGREAINAFWDNSFTITDPTDDYQKGKKTFNIGTVYSGIMVFDSISSSFSAFGGNESFTQQQALKNVILRIPNQEQNKPLFNDIMGNLYKLFIIPEINKFIDKDDNYFADRQWYYIESITKTYDNNTKELAYIDVNFLSLNDKLSKSGLAINQYVQLGAVGEPVAFPAIDSFNTVVLDQSFLLPRPVTHAQISYYGISGNISTAFRGRRIDRNDGQTVHLTPSRLIFPNNYQAGNYDQISFRSLPETNYVMTVGAQRTIDTYVNWKEVVAPLYNDNSQKNFEGHILTDVAKTTATNIQGGANNQFKPYWDQNFLNGVTLDNFAYPTHGNPYLQYFDSDTTNYAGELISYIQNNMNVKNIQNVNAWNYFNYATLTELPLSVRETVKIDLREMPVVGTLINSFLWGLNVGAKLTTNTFLPAFPYVNFLMSAELYRYYSTVFYKTGTGSETDKNLMPYDIFRNDTQDTVSGLFNTTSHMDSMAFNLTDTMRLSEYTLDNNSIRFSAFKTTEDLVQITSDGLAVNLLPKDTDFSLTTPIFDQTIELNGYYIDMVELQAQGKCNVRIQFYSLPRDYTGAVSDDMAIWTGTYQTMAKASGNINIIKNAYVLANNNWDFETTFKYPVPIKAPKLTDLKELIFIDMKKNARWNNGHNTSLKNPAPVNVYKAWPEITEYQRDNSVSPFISINIKDYGYSNIINFQRDYQSLVVNISINAKARMKEITTGKYVTNEKNWNSPVVLDLNTLIKSIGINRNAFKDNGSYSFQNNYNNFDNTAGFSKANTFTPYVFDYHPIITLGNNVFNLIDTNSGETGSNILPSQAFVNLLTNYSIGSGSTYINLQLQKFGFLHPDGSIINYREPSINFSVNTDSIQFIPR